MVILLLNKSKWKWRKSTFSEVFLKLINIVITHEAISPLTWLIHLITKLCRSYSIITPIELEESTFKGVSNPQYWTGSPFCAEGRRERDIFFRSANFRKKGRERYQQCWIHSIQLERLQPRFVVVQRIIFGVARSARYIYRTSSHLQETACLACSSADKWLLFLINLNEHVWTRRQLLKRCSPFCMRDSLYSG